MSSSGGDKLRKDKRSVSLEKRERNHEKKNEKDSKGNTLEYADYDDDRKICKRSQKEEHKKKEHKRVYSSSRSRSESQKKRK